jgi:hypothetical protein
MRAGADEFRGWVQRDGPPGVTDRVGEGAYRRHWQNRFSSELQKVGSLRPHGVHLLWIQDEGLVLRRKEGGHLRQHLAALGRQEGPDVFPEVRSRQAGEDVRAEDHIGVDADRLLALQAAQQVQEVGAKLSGCGPGWQV